MHSRILSVVLSIATTAFALSQVAAQRGDPARQTPPDVAATTTDEALRQSFVAEHEIGRRFLIDPSDLPAPKTGLVVTNRSLTIPYDGQVPQVPYRGNAFVALKGSWNRSEPTGYKVVRVPFKDG